MRPLWILLLCSCALTSKQAPIEFRYFSPEKLAPPGPEQGDASAPKLRLGRVTSSSNLRAPIVYRESPIEVREYVSARWTEDPEDYLRRSLARALFDDGRFTQSFSRSIPTLEVELVAFEELRTPGKHGGRVQLRYQLRDELEVLAGGSIYRELEAKPGIEAAVVAIGAAMDQAAAQLAGIVAARLSLGAGSASSLEKDGRERPR